MKKCLNLKYHSILLLTILLQMLPTTAMTKLNTSEKIIIAHRGASGYLPEHTLEAAAMAYGLGADYIEPDVVLTKDGVPVVLHDIHLDTTTDVEQKFPDRARADGRWYTIDFTLAEIKSLNVHERINIKTSQPVFSTRFPNNLGQFKVPTLSEEIELIQGLNQSTQRNVGIYPELKAPQFHLDEGMDIGTRVLEVLNKYGYTSKEDKVFLQCFDKHYLKSLKNKHKLNIKLIQLIGPDEWKESNTNYTELMQKEGLKEVASYADGIGIWYRQIKDEPNHQPSYVINNTIVDDAHALGLDVHIYTLRKDDLPSYVKSFDELQTLFFDTYNVDGAFTDFTQETFTFLNG